MDTTTNKTSTNSCSSSTDYYEFYGYAVWNQQRCYHARRDLLCDTMLSIRLRFKLLKIRSSSPVRQSLLWLFQACTQLVNTTRAITDANVKYQLTTSVPYWTYCQLTYYSGTKFDSNLFLILHTFKIHISHPFYKQQTKNYLSTTHEFEKIIE